MSETLILEYEGKFGRGRTLEEIVKWVGTLPPMPQAATRALKLVDDPDSTPSEIAAVLSRDPALVSAVMRSANSAALGRAESVTALDEAVLVVGFGSLKTLIIGMTIKKWNKNFGDLEKLVWEKSLGTAAAAWVISTFLGKTYQDTARLCGLLHNLGQIIMLSNPRVRNEYPAILDYIRTHEVDYIEAEREIIGYTHPLVGAMVSHRWQFPMPICNTILKYADPFEGIDGKQDELIALIKLSAQLSMCAGLGFAPGHPLDCHSFQPVALALGFDEETFAGSQEILIKQTLALYATEASTFN